MSATDELTVHIDGAARGNPGPAAFATIFTRNGTVVAREAGCLGRATNNVAEYTALVRALEKAVELSAQRLHIHSDSELLVKQMNGEYKVKNPDLRELYDQAQQLSRCFAQVRITHVARGMNADADRMCNEALDGKAHQGGKTTKPSKPAAGVLDQVREEAILCLQAAAQAWANGNPANPPPADVWDQLWSILEEHRLVRPPTSDTSR